jgi:hypothetical protein
MGRDWYGRFGRLYGRTCIEEIIMLLTIDNANKILPNIGLVIAGNALFMSGIFLFPLFQGEIPTDFLLTVMGVATCVGLCIGIYLKYRANFDVAMSFFLFTYFFLIMEFLFSGSVAVTAPWIGGRPDLRWFALFTNTFCMIASLLMGMYREATLLDWRGKNTSELWMLKMKKYVNYSKHQIIPIALIPPSATEKKLRHYAPLIAAVGSANIPLLFQFYGGGRFNAIFFAVPILTGTFAYINYKYFGPALTRLLLMRKIEKSTGRKFINADLEQIQQLRRGFFMARWLMKDFAPAQAAGTKVR